MLEHLTDEERAAFLFFADRSNGWIEARLLATALDKARAKLAQLREVVNEVSITLPACGDLTGDCPHTHTNDCIPEIIEWVGEHAEALAAALKEASDGSDGE